MIDRLCACLQGVLKTEINRGNSVLEVSEGWPSADSLFISLSKDLNERKYRGRVPSSVTFSICADPYYGWHNECFCQTHKHLLVAGKTHGRK